MLYINTTIICYSIKITQVNMFYWMYAWSTMYLSNVPVYICSYRVAYVVHIYVCNHACVDCTDLMCCLKYQWPWCPAYWPRCPLILFKSQGQLALPSNCPNSRPASSFLTSKCSHAKFEIPTYYSFGAVGSHIVGGCSLQLWIT